MADRKEFKFGFKGEFPKQLLEQVEKAQQRMAVQARELPKSTKDWARELKVMYGEIQVSLSKQKELHDRINRAKELGAHLSDKELKDMERKERYYERQVEQLRRMHAAVKSMVDAQGEPGGHSPHGWVGFGTNMKHAWMRGGVSGAAGEVLHSGVGKLGLAGAAAYGLYKTFSWLQDESAEARQVQTAGLQLARRGGMSQRTLNALMAGGLGHDSNYSTKEMAELAGAMAEETGGAYTAEGLKRLAMLNRTQGLQFSETAGISKMLQRGGMTEAQAVGTFENDIKNSLAEGVAVGIGKSERIASLLRLTANNTIVGRETMKNLAGTLAVFGASKTGLLTGEKGVAAAQAMQGFLGTSEQSVSTFAALAQGPLAGLAAQGREMAEETIGKTQFTQLGPRMQMKAIMESLRNSGKGLDVFRQVMANTPEGYRGDVLEALGYGGISALQMGELMKPGMTESRGKAILQAASKREVAMTETGAALEHSEFLKHMREEANAHTALALAINTELKAREVGLHLAEAGERMAGGSGLGTTSYYREKMRGTYGPERDKLQKLYNDALMRENPEIGEQLRKINNARWEAGDTADVHIGNMKIEGEVQLVDQQGKVIAVIKNPKAQAHH